MDGCLADSRISRISIHPPEPTALPRAWRQGDAGALDRLVVLVHDELRQIAGRHMRHERVGHTLQALALVNEAYLRLIEIKQVQWQNRDHFFAMASRIMRRILVDAARAKAYQKRGADAQRVTLLDTLEAAGRPDLVAVDDALTALEVVDPRNCQVVDLRFYRRIEYRGDGRSAGCFRGHHQARLAAGQSVAVARAQRTSLSRRTASMAFLCAVTACAKAPRTSAMSSDAAPCVIRNTSCASYASASLGPCLKCHTSWTITDASFKWH
jgi:RNA polymerase sigma factor (TIGR02999 family)